MGPPPFQGSDVPLSENILKKPIEFVRSWLEWAADNREQVSSSRGSIGSLFVVPAKNTFYLTGAWIHLSTRNNNANQIDISIKYGSSTSEKVLSCGVKNSNLVGQPNHSNSISMTFPMPIKIQAGQDIELDRSATGSAFVGGIFGFLEPKKIN